MIHANEEQSAPQRGVKPLSAALSRVLSHVHTAPYHPLSVPRLCRSLVILRCPEQSTPTRIHPALPSAVCTAPAPLFLTLITSLSLSQRHAAAHGVFECSWDFP